MATPHPPNCPICREAIRHRDVRDVHSAHATDTVRRRLTVREQVIALFAQPTGQPPVS